MNFVEILAEARRTLALPVQEHNALKARVNVLFHSAENHLNAEGEHVEAASRETIAAVMVYTLHDVEPESRAIGALNLSIERIRVVEKQRGFKAWLKKFVAVEPEEAEEPEADGGNGDPEEAEELEASEGDAAETGGGESQEAGDVQAEG